MRGHALQPAMQDESSSVVFDAAVFKLRAEENEIFGVSAHDEVARSAAMKSRRSTAEV